MHNTTKQDYIHECRALLAIAWPMLIAQLAQVGTGVVDTIMAGRYDAGDLAAVAIGYNVWLPLYLVFTGVMLGQNALLVSTPGRPYALKMCAMSARYGSKSASLLRRKSGFASARRGP